ncbi:hypothetical protein BGX28_006625 [Mortierella sp. GBA30]|nr:hypothetical protein BGX28_006625 [Mortierella sp. GBA30]
MLDRNALAITLARKLNTRLEGNFGKAKSRLLLDGAHNIQKAKAHLHRSNTMARAAGSCIGLLERLQNLEQHDSAANMQAEVQDQARTIRQRRRQLGVLDENPPQNWCQASAPDKEFLRLVVDELARMGWIVVHCPGEADVYAARVASSAENNIMVVTSDRDLLFHKVGTTLRQESHQRNKFLKFEPRQLSPDVKGSATSTGQKAAGGTSFTARTASQEGQVLQAFRRHNLKYRSPYGENPEARGHSRAKSATSSGHSPSPGQGQECGLKETVRVRLSWQKSAPAKTRNGTRSINRRNKVKIIYARFAPQSTTAQDATGRSETHEETGNQHPH